MLTLGILCSGALGHASLVNLIKKSQVRFVMTDKGSKVIDETCKNEKIACYVGNPRKGKGFKFIENIAVDVIVSINYLFLIEEDIIGHPKKLAFNIHGSLLPKYRGRTPHLWSIINNETETGITAHKIEIGCDTGDIIEQIRIPIDKNDTGADLLKKYAQNYTPLIDKVLSKIKSDDLEFTPQNEKVATYYGKRTPEDGLINWEWQKERIRNWIRGQANPYPGAFTFYNENKVIIDKASYSELGFKNEIPNGSIIQIEPCIVVKTGNGALRLDIIRTKNSKFQLGNIFDNENRE